jgi:hypothetical protein
MENVSAYHMQNMYKLKMNRLRMWAGTEEGYHCQARECANRPVGGTAHMIWGCSEARKFWVELRKRRGLATEGAEHGERLQIQEILECKLEHIPE